VSLDRAASPELERPVGSPADLVAWLRAGEKPASAWRVGTEHEKIGLRLCDLRPVEYAGPRGVTSLLERVAALDGWTRVLEGEDLVALTKGGAGITLEPGGQLELSGAPLRTIHETCREFHEHLELVKRASRPAALVWLGLGLSPLIGVEEAPRMPKERYRIMRAYLPSRGEHALHMMHLTATVQANFDFSDEADMVAKLRTATAVTPIVSALFANSSLERGKLSGFVSRRVDIWRHTDPDRCGLLHFVFDPGFGYARYVEWALDVPMFFLVRDGRYRATPGLRFRDFLAHGFEGEHATAGDWAAHLTTLFPEVRLKRVIEVRGADAVPAPLTCALPALWKGLLYDPDAGREARRLVASWGVAEREEALRAVARLGLRARVGRESVLELATELVAIAAEGLRRLARGRPEADERGFLEPLREQLATGKSPGQIVAERWEGEWGRSVERLIEYARY
jgi:glutamate--cysteine ligase